MMSFIKADFFRIKRSKMFWSLVILVSLLAAVNLLSSYYTGKPISMGLKNILATNVSHPTFLGSSFLEMSKSIDILGVFLIVMCIHLWINEFDTNTIKMTVMSPYTRTTIFFSKYISIIISFLFFYFVYFLTIILVALNIFNDKHITTNLFISIIRTSMLQILWFIALIPTIMLFSLILKNKTITTVLLFIYPIVIYLLLTITKQFVSDDLLGKIILVEPLSILSSLAYPHATSFYVYYMIYFLIIIILSSVYSAHIFKKFEIR